ncbi:unnamed protein product [Cercospora beticola]|nr:unnamed protein product [Cercospora beticola]
MSSQDEGRGFGQPPGSSRDDAVAPGTSSTVVQVDDSNNQHKLNKKRNKPTLNCLKCVERKTRCDRARPSCFACTRRETQCEYTNVANIIAEAGQVGKCKRRRRTHERDSEGQVGVQYSPTRTPAFVGEVEIFDNLNAPSYTSNDEQFQQQNLLMAPQNDCDISSMSPIFADVVATFSPVVIHTPGAPASHEQHALLNLFGTGSQHPFQNYWTENGGLFEVIAGLPSKVQADFLVRTYFESIDPIYPIIAHETFLAEFERFWRLSDEEKQKYDPTHVALQFAVFAAATQHTGNDGFVTDHENMSEFYLSCCHQSLCISSYLNRISIPTIQTMVLICHFLMACDRITDAWTIAGIMQRQIYGLKLHHKPGHETSSNGANKTRIQYRLWQAAMFQDTGLSLQMSLPPTTMYHTLDVESLREAESLSPSGFGTTDKAYICAMWQYSEFVQTNICILRSREQPLGLDVAHKQQVIARFRDLYSSRDEPFCLFGSNRFDGLPPRLLYQTATVAINYFHALALLYLDEDNGAGTTTDTSGVITSCHEGMLAFFAMIRLCPSKANAWGPAHNRTFAMATMLGTLLPIQRKESRQVGADDFQYMQGKSDLD